MDYELFYELGIALGLGLLVGLQRERSGSEIAGIRTFPIITMLGAFAGLLAEYWENAWVVAATAMGLALLIFSANYMRTHQDEKQDSGQTTEVAALFMFILGAYVVVGHRPLAVAAGALIAVLLHLKGFLNNFADRLGSKDVRAIMQFAAISLIVLPVLPDETYGPFSVLNPREVWMMVVLIVGLSLTAYFVYKWAGTSVGTITGGLLGGLISSTATTVTYARRTEGNENAGRLAAFVIAVATAVAFVRVITEVAIVIPQHLGVIAPPLVALFLFMSVLCVGLYFFRNDKDDDEIPEPGNPAQLKSALVFGALYAVIIFAVAVAKEYFGQNGLYVVSIISGLTDVDAITLSLSNTIAGGGLQPETGWQLILIASLSNMVFKGGMAIVLGSRQLGWYVGAIFLVTIVAGILILWLWPEGWVVSSFSPPSGGGE